MTAYMDHKDLAQETIGPQRVREINDGVHRVIDKIEAAQAQAGREPGSVRLLAATKTRNVGEIMAALDAGVRMIGENRPQEVSAKIDGLQRLCAERGYAIGTVASASAEPAAVGVADIARSHEAGSGSAASDAADAAAAGKEVPGAATSDAGADREVAENMETRPRIPFHLIGQLQTNKIGKVLPVVDTIESVGSLALAERIARRAVARGITVGVLLEVNESGEASKSGCDPSHAIELAQRIGVMGGIELQGLMTIGAHVSDEHVIRSGFAHLRRTRDLIVQSGAPGTEHCRELSMGMTADMDLAIEEGSTIVRVGTAIFGPRAFV